MYRRNMSGKLKKVVMFIRLFYMWTKKEFHLEEDSLVSSLALDKQLLTNQDQVIMPS